MAIAITFTQVSSGSVVLSMTRVVERRVAGVSVVEVAHVAKTGAIDVLNRPFCLRPLDAAAVDRSLHSRLGRPIEADVEGVADVPEHDRPTTAESDAARGLRKLPQHLLRLQIEVDLARRASTRDRRATASDSGELGKASEQPLESRGEILRRDRLLERRGKPLGHRERNRPVDERHAQSLGERRPNGAPPGTARGGDRDQRPRRGGVHRGGSGRRGARGSLRRPVLRARSNNPAMSASYESDSLSFRLGRSELGSDSPPPSGLPDDIADLR